MTLRERYDTDGFVIIPNLIPDIATQQALLNASERVINNKSWTHRRTVGSQFPPYKPSDDTWGVQHVMHPELDEPSFLAWYTSNDLLDVAKELMGCRIADLQIGSLIK
jgi:hypothetical protein